MPEPPDKRPSLQPYLWMLCGRMALLSWPLEGEAPGLSVWIAAVCSLLGLGLIQGPHCQETGFAAGLALVSAFFSAIAMLALHRLSGVTHLAVVVHFSGVASLVC